MKKIGLICASVLLCGSLAACGNTNSASTSENKSSSSKVSDTINKFGQPVTLSKGNQKAKMVIQSVATVDPDDSLVTDVSHNYKDTHQYVIVTYKVTAISNKVNLDDFDGSNISVYDSKGQSSIASSNRDSVTPKNLHKGETQVMKIGVGLRAKSSKVTIHYGDETWKGKISNEANNSSSTEINSSNESSETTAQGSQTTQSQEKSNTSQQAAASKNSSNGVGNAQDAVNAARTKYGDNNGNVHWNYMIDGTTGQPIKNPDGSYFVKGTANDGTMTGTQYSVNVHPDGSITEN